MDLMNSLLHATDFRSPLFSTLVLTTIIAYDSQNIAAISAVAARSERLYHLSRVLTCLACAWLSLLLPLLRTRAAAADWPGLLGGMDGGRLTATLNWRQVALTGAVSVWAIRLGVFLFSRSTKYGFDSRFDGMRTSALKMWAAFLAQATWAWVVLFPVTAVNSIPGALLDSLSSFMLTDFIGIATWLAGFSVNVTADYQKDKWLEEKGEKKHDEPFMSRGLWSMSRHPNYIGECMMWEGIAIMTAGVLVSDEGQKGLGFSASPATRVLGFCMAAVGALSVELLLYKVSIPWTENKYDKLYGEHQDYVQWKKDTPKWYLRL